jgi:Zn-dependent peptidase ImmA (M78 family)
MNRGAITVQGDRLMDVGVAPIPGGRADVTTSGTDTFKIEIAGDYFASLLLLPRTSLDPDILELAKKLDLRDRGHGLLFVDNQPVNLATYYRFTSELKHRFHVSRAVVHNRLQELGVLVDARDDEPLKVGRERRGSELK